LAISKALRELLQLRFFYFWQHIQFLASNATGPLLDIKGLAGGVDIVFIHLVAKRFTYMYST
jgi:hypothetical protein